jgi:hypothetical protein
MSLGFLEVNLLGFSDTFRFFLMTVPRQGLVLVLVKVFNYLILNDSKLWKACQNQNSQRYPN